MSNGCFATVSSNVLRLGNAFFTREWQLTDAGLLATSFRFGSKEWCAAPSKQPSFLPAGWIRAGELKLSIESRWGRERLNEAEALLVTLSISNQSCHAEFLCKIFPSIPGVNVRLVTFTGGSTHTSVESGIESATGIELAEKKSATDMLTDVIDALVINPLHVDLTEVTFRDQTDHFNNIVFEKTWLLHPNEQLIRGQGNLFILENRLTGEGLIHLKQAPLPHARPVRNEHDLEVRRERVAFLGHGTADQNSGYASTVLAYEGGKAGRTAILHELQRKLRVRNPALDGQFIANTWGDRSRDGRISDTFLNQEIDAAKKLGVDTLQIDDGWQKGTSANSVERGGVWESFWQFDANFWDPHPTRLPNGLKPLIDRAKAAGIGLGLWFAPDSYRDFENWQKDAAALAHYFREYGICQIKIDGVKSRTKLGEARLRQFFDEVETLTDAQVVFDQDSTAEIRPTYFGMMDTGAIFVENRYTDWHGYWPHQTLRNLWQLSQYIDPIRLRMEFLNPDRNRDKYVGDVLAPAEYPADYLFASVMMASPLGWFECSGLSAAFVEKVAPLVQIWKQHREAIYKGRTFPIGQTPDGTSWTGFANLSTDGNVAYLLFFREWNDCDRERMTLPSIIAGEWRVERLSGVGEVEIEGAIANVHISHRLNYLWIRATRE